MTKTELINKLAGLRCQVNELENIFLISYENHYIVEISKKHYKTFCLFKYAWIDLSDELKDKIFDILIEYTSTPVDERISDQL